MVQRQGIRRILVLSPPPPHPLVQNIPLHHPFQMQAPAPPSAPTMQPVMQAQRWGVNLRSLLRICNASMSSHLPDICRTVAPLEKDMARASMEASYKRTAESLCFRPLHISHAVAVMVMALAFHTKDPDRV